MLQSLIWAFTGARGNSLCNRTTEQSLKVNLFMLQDTTYVLLITELVDQLN